MRNQENKKPSHRDVMPAVANFLENTFPEEIQELPETFQYWFEVLLETEMMDDVNHRIECLRSLRTLRDLAAKLKPFSENQLKKAVKEICHA